MLRYASIGVPRAELAAVFAALLMTLASVLHSAPMWRGLVLAVVLLVAFAALAADEPAAAIVDATPTSLRRRTAARLLVLLPALGLWLAYTAIQVRRPWFPAAGTAAEMVLIGVGGLLVGIAAATVQRRRGQATPGTSTATAVGLLTAALGAFPRHLPLHPSAFPGVPAREWTWALGFWGLVTAFALLALAAATSEGRRRLPWL